MMDFDPNNRAAIDAALQDPDPNNPVARAVATRLTAFAQILAEATEKQGRVPDEITIGKPQTVLDEVAIDLFRRTLEEAEGAPRLVILDYGRQ